MIAIQQTLSATPTQLAKHYIDGVFIQAPSTNSQNAYIGDAGKQIVVLAPNTTLTLSNIPDMSLIWVKGTANDKLNIIGQ